MSEKNLEGKFIQYGGRYWLIEKYNPELYKGGFFASPIYFNEEQKAEVRPAGSNWCYKCNGAFLKNPEKNVIIEAYESQLKHLKWCKEMQKESLFDNDKDHKECLLKVNTKIDYYTKLLEEIKKVVKA